jgi:hypothetical protein
LSARKALANRNFHQSKSPEILSNASACWLRDGVGKRDRLRVRERERERETHLFYESNNKPSSRILIVAGSVLVGLALPQLLAIIESREFPWKRLSERMEPSSEDGGGSGEGGGKEKLSIFPSPARLPRRFATNCNF